MIDLSYNQQCRVGSRLSRGPGANLGSSPGQTSVGQSPAHLVYQILVGREGDTEKMRGECWMLYMWTNFMDIAVGTPRSLGLSHCQQLTDLKKWLSLSEPHFSHFKTGIFITFMSQDCFEDYMRKHI